MLANTEGTLNSVIFELADFSRGNTFLVSILCYIFVCFVVFLLYKVTAFSRTSR